MTPCASTDCEGAGRFRVAMFMWTQRDPETGAAQTRTRALCVNACDSHSTEVCAQAVRDHVVPLVLHGWHHTLRGSVWTAVPDQETAVRWMAEENDRVAAALEAQASGDGVRLWESFTVGVGTDDEAEIVSIRKASE